MNITEDKEVLIQCQVRFTRELVKLIRHILLSETGLSPDQVRQLTRRLAFEMTNLIDTTGAVSADGCTFSPNLTFMSNGDEDEDEVARHIADPAGTWMHEYALGIVDDIFDNPAGGLLTAEIVPPKT